MNDFDLNQSSINIIKGKVEIPEKVERCMKQTLDSLPERKARKRSFSKAAIVAAACLLAVPTVAFAAYVSGENSAFYQAIFGNTSRQSVHEKVEYDSEGKLSLNLPNIERVDVDEEQAEELVGRYVKALGETYELESYHGHTISLTVHSALYDKETGIFQAYLSLEQPGGVQGLEMFEDGECYFSGNDLLLYGDMAPGKLYYDKAKSSDDIVYLTAVGVAHGDGDKVMEFGEYIPKEDLKPEDAAQCMDEGMQRSLAKVDFSSMASSLPGKKAGEAIIVNSLGMQLNLPGLGFTDAVDDYDLKYLAIEYSDGESYILRDRDRNIENIDYGLTKGPQYEGDPNTEAVTTYCFNRLVDVDKVSGVTINNQHYDAK